MIKLRFSLGATLVFLLMTTPLSAQIVDPDVKANLGRSGGYIQTAVPFLLISPDSRAGALADIGVSTSPDINSQHWNAAKYPFIKDKAGISLSYSPWLRALVSDMNLLYLSGYYKPDERSAIAASLLFFSLGEVIFRSSGEEAGVAYRPNEYAVDVSYSRMLSDNFSIGIAARYIRSDLTQGYAQVSGHAANTGAADLGLFYTKGLNTPGLAASNISAGFHISNLGAKVSYSESTEKAFLPANLRLGVAYRMDFDKYNSLTAMVEFNKLLVPTPPIRDSAGNVVAGRDDRVAVFTGAIQSFYDAPGGFGEEMKEVNWSLGLEYWYGSIFSFRGGYFFESKEKGDRKYIGLGAGVRFSVVELDASYLIPTGSGTTNSPLKNTLRITVGFNFSKYNAERRAKAKASAQQNKGSDEAKSK